MLTERWARRTLCRLWIFAVLGLAAGWAGCDDADGDGSAGRTGGAAGGGMDAPGGGGAGGGGAGQPGGGGAGGDGSAGDGSAGGGGGGSVSDAGVDGGGAEPVDAGPGPVPLPDGGVGGPCDGPGDCWTPSACVLPLCISGECSGMNALAGTPVPEAQQTSGDCLRLECDGAGEVRSVSDLDDAPAGGCAGPAVYETGTPGELRDMVTPFYSQAYVNLYAVTQARTLQSFDVHLVSDEADYGVRFVVFEADTEAGPFELVWQQDAALSMGDAADYVSSGAVDGVALEAGRYYALGILSRGSGEFTQITGPLQVSRIQDAEPADPGFGEILGGRNVIGQNTDWIESFTNTAMEYGTTLAQRVETTP